MEASNATIGEASVAVTDDNDDDDERSYVNGNNSDCSVGDITETSITDETHEDRPRASVLASSLSEQQQDISLALASMVTKMAIVLDTKETENERLLGRYSEESQKERQGKSEKYTKAVNAMAKKQAKLARQFEKLVADLEESNRQKDLERVQLKKQVSTMKERIQQLKASSSSNGRRFSSSKPPGLPKPKSRHGKPSHHHHHYGSPSEAGTLSTEAFSITEISFSSTVVDVTAIMSNHESSMTSMEASSTSCTMDSIPATGENVRFLL